MRKLILKSPAKLNLYLDVLRKRRDGYHDIETLFEKIGLFDIITIRGQKRGIAVTSDRAGVPNGEANLAHKAAKALFDRVKFKGGAKIHIEKRIPVAAGLGGGSSNAAVVLLGLNDLLGFGLGRAQLVEIGKRLGADVPFFLYDYGFAFGRGRGDEIYPLDNNTIIWNIVISFNNIATSAGQVYKALNLGLTPGGVDATILPRFLHKKQVENLGSCLYNKLEEVVLKKFEIAGKAKRVLLEEGAYAALMSGSGPTVFGITKTREEAIALGRRVLRNLGGSAFKGNIFIAKTWS